jgi:hypothetical protein
MLARRSAVCPVSIEQRVLPCVLPLDCPAMIPFGKSLGSVLALLVTRKERNHSMMNQNLSRLRRHLPLLLPVLMALLISLTFVHDDAHAGSALSVSITSPSNHSVVGTGTQVPVTAAVSQSDATLGISRVEFSLSVNGGNGMLLGTATTAPYTINWSVQSSQVGTAVLTAKAFDRLGHSAISAPVSVFVAVLDPLPPPR